MRQRPISKFGQSIGKGVLRGRECARNGLDDIQKSNCNFEDENSRHIVSVHSEIVS